MRVRVGVGEFGEIHAVDDHVAGIGLREPAQQVKQRGLPAAGRADNADKFTLLTLKKFRAAPALRSCRRGRFCAVLTASIKGFIPSVRSYTNLTSDGMEGI